MTLKKNSQGKLGRISHNTFARKSPIVYTISDHGLHLVLYLRNSDVSCQLYHFRLGPIYLGYIVFNITD